MLVIPAIDIINGQCVRLTRGEYDTKKIYGEDPLIMAQSFQNQGAMMLHVVDLDGAKSGMPDNIDLILKIQRELGLPIQVGGGIRNIDTVARYLNGGVDRVILSTVAVKDLELLRRLVKEFGNSRIVVSLDIRNGKLATNGWLETSDQDIFAILGDLRETGITEVIVTDILKDGTLTVPNFETIGRVQAAGFNVIAAGGVSSAESLRQLRNMNIAGAILGKALYEGIISLPVALQVVNTPSNLAKRIIPCLDVKDGRVVKGVHFENLRDAGDPVELGKYYSDEGADELVFLDIAATKEKRKTMIDVVRRVAQQVNIPFTVGGGVNTIEDIRDLLLAGADKVSLNTSAVLNPDLVRTAAEIFGNQCIVVAIDVKKVDDVYTVFIKGGSQKTDKDVLTWVQEAERLGAGEILLTSMDRDGTKMGFDLELLQIVSESVNIPVIASGGAGSLQNIVDAFSIGRVDAVLAASLFHYKEISISQLKQYLQFNNIIVRI